MSLPRSRVLAALTLVLLLAPAALAGVPRTVEKEYTGSGVLYCSGAHGVYGGQCFALDGSEAFASVTIDDAIPLDVYGYWNFRKAFADPSNPDDRSLADGFFCGSVTGIPVPAGAEILDVVVSPPESPGCGLEAGFTGTRGTITVQWS